ncbi:hypothetical protein BGI40_11040 [Snodgrassella communis]|nr:hypothetical protein BGI40_11040 [Snodgrassella communis]
MANLPQIRSLFPNLNIFESKAGTERCYNSTYVSESAKKKHKIAAFILNRRGRPFILSSQDEPHLYCTTLLSDAIAQFHPSFKPKWNYISAPFFKGEYLFPQAFVDYPDTKVIYRVNNLIM